MQLKTKKTNEMKFPTCSFSLRGPTGPRLLRTRTRPPSSFVFTQPEGGYHCHHENSEFSDGPTVPFQPTALVEIVSLLRLNHSDLNFKHCR